MKKSLKYHIFYLLLLLTLSNPIYPNESLKGPFEKEIRGVWIASVYNLDWPSQPNITQEKSEQEIIQALNFIQDLKFNTIYLQVKPAWGVLYQSKLEPISGFLSSNQQKHSQDLLSFWINEAHKRNIFIHAWINPFRVLSNYNSYPQKEANWYKPLSQKSNIAWLDPSYPEVRDHTLKICHEILTIYDFDGIHLDDYFYPDNQYLKSKSFQDEKEYILYKRQGGLLSQENWRRENINQFVEKLSQYIKAYHPEKSFSISSPGIWKPSQAYQIKGGSSFDDIYADSLKWLKEKWIDYLIPQFYWSFERPFQNFNHLITWWKNHSQLDSSIVAGVLTEPIGNQKMDLAKEIQEQYKLIKKNNLKGTVYFRLQTLRENLKVQETLKHLFSKPALPILSYYKRGDAPIVEYQENSITALNMKKNQRLWLKIQKEDNIQEYVFPYSLKYHLPFSKKPNETWEILYINPNGTITGSKTLF